MCFLQIFLNINQNCNFFDDVKSLNKFGVLFSKRMKHLHALSSVHCWIFFDQFPVNSGEKQADLLNVNFEKLYIK